MQRIVSIGVPARNEEGMIAATLRGLLAQALPPGLDLEVIVCLNACTDRTAQVVDGLRRANARLRLLEAAEPGKPNAVNLIKQHARGDEVVLCDADTLVEAQAVAKLLRVLDSRPELHAVTARTRAYTRPRPGWIEVMAAMERNTSPYAGIDGAFYAIRKACLPDFPKDIIHEDVWLSCHLGDARFAVATDVDARKRVPSTARDFLAQRLRWEAAKRQFEADGLRFFSDGFHGRLRQRMSRIKELRFHERLLLVPAAFLFLYGKWGGRRAYRRKAFERGWVPPAR